MCVLHAPGCKLELWVEERRLGLPLLVLEYVLRNGCHQKSGCLFDCNEEIEKILHVWYWGMSWAGYCLCCCCYSRLKPAGGGRGCWSVQSVNIDCGGFGVVINLMKFHQPKPCVYWLSRVYARLSVFDAHCINFAVWIKLPFDIW